MRKIYFLIVTLFSLLVLNQNTNGQLANQYIYSSSTGAALDPMTGATTIVASSVDDTPSPLQNIGFTFNYEGLAFTQYSVSPDGFIRLGSNAAVDQFTNNITSTTNVPKIFPFWDDLHTGTDGSVSTVVTGTAPNRILVVQWFVTVPRNTGGAANSTMQAWLYESTNVIEFRYGVGAGPTGSASIGINGVTPTNFISITTPGNTAGTTTANNAVTEWPGNGTMYTFFPPPPCVPGSLSGGTLSVPSNPVCSGIPFTITATGASFGIGLTYQWQSSPDGVTFTDISGATTELLTTTITTNTYFKRKITCSGTDAFSDVLLASVAPPVATPFTEDFATYAVTFPPGCWSRNNATFIAGFAPSAFGNGTGSVRFNFYNASASTVLDFTSPSFAPVAAGHRLTFNYAYATFSGEVDHLEILYSTDGGATFNDLVSYDGGTSGPLNTGGATFASFSPTAAQWGTKLVDLPAGTNRLLFRGISEFGNNLFLDNITVEPIPPCLPPTDLTAIANTQTTATLNWTASLSSPANGYQWEVRTSGAAGSGAAGLAAAGTTAAGVTTASVTGLTSNTIYSYYVRSDCGGFFSTWEQGLTTFTTPCDPIAIPFRETFATYATTFPPMCWSANDAVFLTGQSPSANAIGVGSAKFDFYNAATGTMIDLVSPQFTPVPANFYLMFDHAYATFAFGGNDQLEILYSTNGGATYTSLTVYDGDATGPLNTGGAVFPAFSPAASEWASKIVALPAGTNRLLFRGISAFGNNLFLDNIAISSCLPPTALTVTATTQTTATLSWTASASSPSNGYEWEVRTSGAAGSGATGLAASGTTAAGVITADVTGLTSNTTYTYYVRSNCGSDFSIWSAPFSFTTPCDPIAIPFNENFSAYQTQFPPLCWTRNNTTLLTGNAASGYGAGAGSVLFDFYNAAAGTTLELTSPQFTPVSGSYFLAFDHAYATFLDGAVDELQILYSTNGGLTYTNLMTYAGGNDGPLNTGGASFGGFIPTATQWATKIIALPAGTNKLLFRGLSAFGNNLYVDNIIITSCLPPTALTVTATTQTTTTLSWTASVSSPANGYEWEVRTSGAAGSGATGLIASGTTAGGVTTANVTGLTAFTTYSYYVRSACGSSDFSIWGGPFTFTTPCNPIALPVFENFATYTTTFPPTCWNRNSTTLLTGQGPSAFGAGTGSALFDFYNAAAGTNLELLSPEFTPVSGSYFLTFDHAYATFLDGAVDQLEILYSTNGGATYTDLISYDGGNSGPLNTGGASFGPFAPTATQWATKIIALPAGTNKILFRGVSAFGNNLYLDNITVTSCLPPSGLTVTALAPTTATLSWTASTTAPANGYVWEVRTSGLGGSGATGLVATGTTAAGVTTANVTGLTAYTAYSYYVRSNCSGSDLSTWAGPFTFTTPCDPINTPFSENFVNYISNFPPTCWLRNNTTLLAGDAPSAYGLSTGSAKFDFYNAAAGTILELTSPLFTPVPANYGLTFDHAYATFIAENDQLQILYSTDGGITYTNLINYAGGASGPLNTGGTSFPAFVPTASQWATKVIILPVGTNRVLFRGTSAFGNNLYLDNISVSSCLPPTGLTVTFTTQTTANLSWTGSISTPANGYQWEVRTSGVGGSGATGLAASGTTAAGTTTATATGLTANTTYSYYVRSDCGGEFSVWGGPNSFTTPCDPISTPFIENFATYATTFPPNCWRRNNTTLLIGQAPSGYGVGTGSAKFDFYNASAGTALELLSPQFTPVTGYFLAFDHAYATFLDGAVDQLQILYSTNAGATFTSLITYDGGNGGPLNTGGASFGPFTPTAAQWATKIIALPAGTNKLLFRGTSAFGNNLFVDNINITACVPPTGLTVTFAAQTTANLSWTASASAPANGYEWEVRTSGAAGSGATGLVTSGTIAAGVTTVTATGLTAATTYRYYVRSNCGSEFSIWAGPFTFTTPCNPIGIPFIENFATYTTTFPPTCWTRTSTAFILGQAPSAYGVGAGSALFDFYNAAAGTTFDLVTPQFTPVAGNFFLAFDHAYATFSGENDQLQILYSTNAGLTYTSLITYDGGTSGPLNTGGTVAPFPFAPTASQWATKIIALPAGTNKIIFRGTSAFGNDLYLDNILITSCLPPTGLTLSAIAPTAVTLSWTASVSLPSNGYEWEVRTSGAPGSGATGLIASGATAAGVITADVTGLTAFTNYRYYVRSVCGGSDFSIWSSPYAFTTPCDPIAVPFTETFASTTFPPTCWLRSSTTLSVRQTASAYGIGSGSAKFDFYNAGAGTNIELTSPLFAPLPAGLGLVFDHAYATFAGENDQLEILYSTNGGATYTNLITYNGGAGGPLNTGGSTFSAFTPSASQWSNKAVILPAGANRLLFRGISAFGNNLYLDNIAIVSCLPPTSVRAIGISSTSAQVTFTSTVGSYIVEYGPTGFTPGTGATAGAGGTVVTGTSSPITVTGLTASTAYDFYVRSVCTPGSDYSVNVKTTATTLCAATSIPYVQNFESAVVPAIPACTSIQTIAGNPWTVQNNPGSGFTSRTLRYNWNTNLAANSWFYTQGLNLTAGTSYRLTYRYGNNSSFFTENLKVAYGTGAVATAMTTTLADHINIVGGTPNTNALDFTPPTTGVYYIGFQAHSDADQFYLFVDDINVKITPLVDVGATGIIPVRCASVNGVVQAIFRNYNLTAVNFATYPVTLTGTLSGASSGTVTGTINTGTLAPGAYDTIPLSGFNFVAGTYNIVLTTSSPDDPETANDSYTTSFVVNPLPVTAVISPAAPQICAGNVIQLNAQFAASPRPLVSWSPTTSLYINAAATLGYFGGDSLTVYAKPTTTTTYTVTTTDRVTGCTNTSTVTVTVNPLPVVTIAALPAKICTSDEIIPLTATPVTGTWSGIGVVGNSFRPPLVAAVGTYTLSYTYTDPVTTCTTVATIAAKVEDCPERIILLRDNAVTIYPNPNNGQFNIKMNSVLYNKLMMRVYTNTGVLVRAQELNGLAYGRVVSMNLSYLPAGAYMVRFSYNGGPRTSEKTFNVIITH